MMNYEKATKALTGTVFLFLGISIMNYGTKLETAISKNNEQHTNASHSSSQSSSYFQHQQQQTGQRNNSGNQSNNLETRIFYITIILSLIFLCRFLVDCLYAWNLLNVQFNNPKVDFILIFFTEVIPCLVISKIMKKKTHEAS